MSLSTKNSSIEIALFRKQNFQSAANLVNLVYTSLVNKV